MSKHHYKNHPSTIFLHVLGRIKELFFFAIFVYILDWFKLSTLVSLFLIGVLLITIFTILQWKHFSIKLEDETLFLQKGILFKKRLQIPFERITAVDLEQRPVQNLLKTNQVNVTSPSSGPETEPIRIVLKHQHAHQFRNHIMKNDVQLKIDGIQATTKELFIYGLTRSSLLSLFGLTISAYFLADQMMELASIDNSALFGKITGLLANHVGITILLVILLLILAKVMTTAITMLRYYNFTLYKRENRLVVEYGFFTKKSQSIPIENIFGLKETQSPLYQWTGYHRLQACSLGLQGDFTSQSFLFPTADKEKLSRIIDEYLPEFTYTGTIQKVDKRRAPSFFIWKQLVYIPIIMMLILINPWFSLLALGIPVLIAQSYLLYINTSIGQATDNLLVSAGAYYKKQYILKSTGLDAITYSHHYFQRKYRVQTYKLKLRNGGITLKHLPIGLADGLEKFLL